MLQSKKATRASAALHIQRIPDRVPRIVVVRKIGSSHGCLWNIPLNPDLLFKKANNRLSILNRIFEES